MNRILLCFPATSVGFWTYAFLVLVCVGFLLAFFARLIWPSNHGREDFVGRWVNKVIRLRGPAVYALLSLLVLILMLGLRRIDSALDLGIHPSPAEVDLSAGEALGEVMSRYQRLSDRAIVLGLGADALLIKGQYQGSCVADLIHSICVRNSEVLSCDLHSKGQTVHINLKQR